MSTAAADGAATSPLEYRVSAQAAHGGDAEVAAAQVVVPIDAGWAIPPTVTAVSTTRKSGSAHA